ncbi:MAG: four helix bundle protein [Chlorobi bacterium]|nr:four helix bundle protein [Chlorobiota bacterium]
MSKEEWINYKIEVRERLRVFALKILELSDMLPKTTKGNVINYQITKSGTSEYANYRAALRGRSKNEFFSKLSITVEEADETEMWLDLIISGKILTNKFVKDLHEESLELVKILSNMRKNIS